MKEISYFCAALLLVSGCMTARMEVQNGLTDRGFVATRSFELGEVRQWLPDQNLLLPLGTIEVSPRSFGEVESLRVNFETGVEFKGGIELSEDQKAALESEVASRTTTLLTNASTKRIENVTTAVINDWNTRPEVWLTELGIADRGWPASNRVFVVFFFEETVADGLKIEVDKTAAAGTEFQSGVLGPNGNVDFKITDAASVEFTGQATPVLYDFALVRIRNTTEGPRFSQVTDPRIRDALAAFFTQ